MQPHFFFQKSRQYIALAAIIIRAIKHVGCRLKEIPTVKYLAFFVSYAKVMYVETLMLAE